LIRREEKKDFDMALEELRQFLKKNVARGRKKRKNVLLRRVIKKKKEKGGILNQAMERGKSQKRLELLKKSPRPGGGR